MVKAKQNNTAKIPRQKIFQTSSIIAELLKHHLITAFNLSVHIHDPVHNGPGIELGIVPVNSEFPTAVFGIPMEGPNRIVQMVGLHLLNRDCAIFGGP